MTTQEILAAAGIVYVEIDGSGQKPSRMVTVKATGAQQQMPGSQTAYIWQGGKYPVEVAVDYDDKDGPYRPGVYLLSGSIFAAGDYGRINFKGGRDLTLVLADDLFDQSALAAPKAKAA